MNKVILIGNLTKEVEVKKTQSGKSVCEFSLAINMAKDQSEFVSCQAWDKTADVIGMFASKGNKLCVEGHIHTNSWEDQTGKKQYKTVVVADRIEFLSKKEVNETNAPIYENTPTISKEEPKQDNYIDIKSDDLPFY